MSPPHSVAEMQYMDTVTHWLPRVVAAIDRLTDATNRTPDPVLTHLFEATEKLYDACVEGARATLTPEEDTAVRAFLGRAG